jgi:hypothetical protein
MTQLFWASYVLLWLLVVILVLLVLLIYRQYGEVLMPARQRMRLRGLDIGAVVPDIKVQDTSGQEAIIPLSQASGEVELRVVLAASAGCSICATLWESVGALRGEFSGIEYWWVQFGEPKNGDRPLGWQVLTDAKGLAHGQLRVPGVPYAYAFDTTGTVRAKGLMNDLDDFRGLIGETSAVRRTAIPQLTSGGTTDGATPATSR